MTASKKYKREALILAGGMGTRLKSAVPDLPKCLAPVAGRPFMDFVVDHAIRQRVEHIVFCLGYMAPLIKDHIRKTFKPHVDVSIVIEKEALGTGGAIRNGAKKIKGEAFIALNGDSLFSMVYDDLYHLYPVGNHLCNVGLKNMKNFDRYGTVELANDGNIVSFLEKKPMAAGLINGGIYLINKQRLMDLDLDEKFSMEKEVLEVYSQQGQIKGVISDAYFIDIGIPRDFELANIDLAKYQTIF